MFNGSNWDRKSQLSEILTEPSNPRGVRGQRFVKKESLQDKNIEI